MHDDFDQDPDLDNNLNTILDKVCAIFSLNIIQKEKLQEKLFEVEKLFDISQTEISISDYFNQLSDACANQVIRDHHTAFVLMVQVMLMNLNAKHIQLFVSEYNNFISSLEQIKNLRLKACNAYIELFAIQDHIKVYECRVFLNDLLKGKYLFHFFKSRATEPIFSFLKVVVEKIEGQINLLQEKFCQELIQMEKLPLLDSVNTKEGRVNVIKLLDPYALGTKHIIDINKAINELNDIKLTLIKLYDELEQTPYQLLFYKAQSKILNQRITELNNDISELFKFCNTDVIKRSIIDTIAINYPIDFPLRDMGSCQRSQSLIQKVLITCKSHEVAELISEKLEGVNFMPLFIDNKNFVDNIFFMRKISVIYIKNKVLNRLQVTDNLDDFVDGLLQKFVSMISIPQLEKLFFTSTESSVVDNVLLDLIRKEVQYRANFKHFLLSFFGRVKKRNYRDAKRLLVNLNNPSLLQEVYCNIDNSLNDMSFDFLAEEIVRPDNEVIAHAKKLIKAIQKCGK